MSKWRIAFALAVLAILAISPLLQLRDRWLSNSDSSRMREIHRRISILKTDYMSGKEEWSSSQVLAEMKSTKEKMKTFTDEQLERYRKLKASYELSYYRTPSGEANLAEQVTLQSEYRDALWRHPDWQVASETFPSVSEP